MDHRPSSQDERRVSQQSSALAASPQQVAEAEQLKSHTMALLCLVVAVEGADFSLFPATMKALEEDVGLMPMKIGMLGMSQALVIAVLAPFWGILASRAVLTRKSILIIGCVSQGICLCLIACATDFPQMVFLRGLNGAALAALRPVSGSLVADLFPDLERGRMFGMLSFSIAIGAAFFGLVAASISRQMVFGYHGWQVGFVTVGVFSFTLGPVLGLLMQDIPVKVPHGKAGVVNIREEFETLWRLLKIPTFLSVVMQGCFGGLPWRALDFCMLFFQIMGLSDFHASLIASMGQLSRAPGAYIGGAVGDALAKRDRVHGRIWCAQATVFIGMACTSLMFTFTPPENWKVAFYLACITGLGLFGSWAGTGTNPPLLCTVSEESERSLVLAWEGAMEGSIAATGPMVFGFFAQVVFGYDKDSPATGDNASAVSQALFWSCFVPWTICGLIYTSLHWSYPKDLAEIERLKEEKRKGL